MILAFRDLKFSRAWHLYFKIYIHKIYLVLKIQGKLK